MDGISDQESTRSSPSRYELAARAAAFGQRRVSGGRPIRVSDVPSVPWYDSGNAYLHTVEYVPTQTAPVYAPPVNVVHIHTQVASPMSPPPMPDSTKAPSTTQTPEPRHVRSGSPRTDRSIGTATSHKAVSPRRLAELSSPRQTPAEQKRSKPITATREIHENGIKTVIRSVESSGTMLSAADVAELKSSLEQLADKVHWQRQQAEASRVKVQEATEMAAKYMRLADSRDNQIRELQARLTSVSALTVALADRYISSKLTSSTEQDEITGMLNKAGLPRAGHAGSSVAATGGQTHANSNVLHNQKPLILDTDTEIVCDVMNFMVETVCQWERMPDARSKTVGAANTYVESPVSPSVTRAAPEITLHRRSLIPSVRLTAATTPTTSDASKPSTHIASPTTTAATTLMSPSTKTHSASSPLPSQATPKGSQSQQVQGSPQPAVTATGVGSASKTTPAPPTQQRTHAVNPAPAPAATLSGTPATSQATPSVRTPAASQAPPSVGTAAVAATSVVDNGDSGNNSADDHQSPEEEDSKVSRRATRRDPVGFRTATINQAFLVNQMRDKVAETTTPPLRKSTRISPSPEASSATNSAAPVSECALYRHS